MISVRNIRNVCIHKLISVSVGSHQLTFAPRYLSTLHVVYMSADEKSTVSALPCSQLPKLLYNHEILFLPFSFLTVVIVCSVDDRRVEVAEKIVHHDRVI